MIYRAYVPNDFAQLFAIEQACFQPPHRFGRAYLRELVNSTSAATWVAEEDGIVMGFAVVDWTSESGDLVAYIQTIEVFPEQRGRGIGRELLRQAEDSARSAGARAIWLHVEQANQAAIRLYKVGGYQCEGREDGYYGRGRAALIYAKILEPRGERPGQAGLPG